MWEYCHLVSYHHFFFFFFLRPYRRQKSQRGWIVHVWKHPIISFILLYRRCVQKIRRSESAPSVRDVTSKHCCNMSNPDKCIIQLSLIHSPLTAAQLRIIHCATVFIWRTTLPQDLSHFCSDETDFNLLTPILSVISHTLFPFPLKTQFLHDCAQAWQFYTSPPGRTHKEMKSCADKGRQKDRQLVNTDVNGAKVISFGNEL